MANFGQVGCQFRIFPIDAPAARDSCRSQSAGKLKTTPLAADFDELSSRQSRRRQLATHPTAKPSISAPAIRPCSASSARLAFRLHHDGRQRWPLPLSGQIVMIRCTALRISGTCRSVLVEIGQVAEAVAHTQRCFHRRGNDGCIMQIATLDAAVGATAENTPLPDTVMTLPVPAPASCARR